VILEAVGKAAALPQDKGGAARNVLMT